MDLSYDDLHSSDKKKEPLTWKQRLKIYIKVAHDHTTLTQVPSEPSYIMT